MKTTPAFRPVSRRLHRAFLLALVAPAAAACGGTTSASSGDAGGQTDGAGSPDGTGMIDSGSLQDSAVLDDSSTIEDSGPLPDVTWSTDCGSGILPASSGCTSFTYVPCGYDGGPVSTEECKAVCADTTDSGMTLVNCYGYPSNGETFLACSYCLPAGRRSAGQGVPPEVGDSPGSFFAHCAYLEQGSVHAFRRLARELEAHGAPASLVARALRAAVEESAHARTTRRLARRFGGVTVAARTKRLPVRDLATIARENAVEGCVRETYGVLVAKWQARTAHDPRVRAALRTIARDEARHADIASRVAAWVEGRLTATERRDVRRACRRAVEDLCSQIAFDPPRVLVEQVGLPRAADARRLLEAALREGVFDRAAA